MFRSLSLAYLYIIGTRSPLARNKATCGTEKVTDVFCVFVLLKSHNGAV